MKSYLLVVLTAVAAMANPVEMSDAEAHALAMRDVVERAVGSSCSYNGMSGSCQHTGHCGSTLDFYVSGKCPNDPDDVRCCITKSCNNKKGGYGWCMNKSTAGSFCKEYDGHFEAGFCPGPNDVACCVMT
ncbi:hypothetical protein M501DRAFT_991247 [Patellaria atrata CBS 101060]|uniref:Uncharacterized protein n=1 Tax=Patellaria atrata CBS 101060 TaxID=1346257 RepID=A0A9P4VS96_9PEZI|nr:hypothetical protein M501DRAFT_991247 [Patellaria atrata CBS 101060]